MEIVRLILLRINKAMRITQCYSIYFLRKIFTTRCNAHFLGTVCIKEGNYIQKE